MNLVRVSLSESSGRARAGASPSCRVCRRFQTAGLSARRGPAPARVLRRGLRSAGLTGRAAYGTRAATRTGTRAGLAGPSRAGPDPHAGLVGPSQARHARKQARPPAGKSGPAASTAGGPERPLPAPKSRRAGRPPHKRECGPGLRLPRVGGSRFPPPPAPPPSLCGCLVSAALARGADGRRCAPRSQARRAPTRP